VILSQRPQRTRKVSQRAAPIAARVTKYTNNTTRAAVTQALLAPAMPAATPTEPITEVIIAPMAEVVAAPAAEVVTAPDVI
jgi:hypothetical protein